MHIHFFLWPWLTLELNSHYQLNNVHAKIHVYTPWINQDLNIWCRKLCVHIFTKDFGEKIKTWFEIDKKIISFFYTTNWYFALIYCTSQSRDYSKHHVLDMHWIFWEGLSYSVCQGLQLMTSNIYFLGEILCILINKWNRGG